MMLGKLLPRICSFEHHCPTKHLNSILDWDPREILSLHTMKKSRPSSLVKLSLLHKRVFLQDIRADVHGQYSTEKRYIAYRCT